MKNITTSREYFIRRLIEIELELEAIDAIMSKGQESKSVFIRLNQLTKDRKLYSDLIYQQYG